MFNFPIPSSWWEFLDGGLTILDALEDLKRFTECRRFDRTCSWTSSQRMTRLLTLRRRCRPKLSSCHLRAHQRLLPQRPHFRTPRRRSRSKLLPCGLKDLQLPVVMGGGRRSVGSGGARLDVAEVSPARLNIHGTASNGRVDAGIVQVRGT